MAGREAVESLHGEAAAAARMLGVRGPVDLVVEQGAAGSPLAWARRRRVHVDRRLLREPAARRRAVIAHEVAHVAQFENGLRGGAESGRAALEAEADLAAGAVLRGRPFRVTGAHAGNAPLFWNRFGHYYTVFATAVAVGVEGVSAMRIATGAQLPDLINELVAPTASAAACGLYYYRSLPIPEQRKRLTRYVQTFPQIGTPDPGVIPNNSTECLAVSMGLHCLTGRSHRQERIDRFKTMNRLASSRWESVDFGLSLHAYGDVFAHTPDGATQYGPIFGHGLDYYQQPGVNTSFLIEENMGHGADNTNLMYEDKYGPYLNSLYNAFLNIPARSRSVSPISLYEVKHRLGGIGRYRQNDHVETTQILDAKLLIQEWHTKLFGKRTIIWDPPDDCVSCANFKDWNGLSGNLQKMLALGASWAGPAPADLEDTIKWALRVAGGMGHPPPDLRLPGPSPTPSPGPSPSPGWR